MFWGASPALDLQETLNKLQVERSSLDHKFLIISGCDARHVIKTIAQSYRHKKVNLNFDIVDGCPDQLAREILLLSIALEKTTYTGLLEKTRKFLEVYGNTLLRTSTSRYVTAKAKQITKLVTDTKLMTQCLPINIEGIKYKERDYIETLSSFWTFGATNTFDICHLWERRLRQSLGVRYDARAGVFDWDYHMRLKEVAKPVCSHEYKHFREHGVGFTWLETEICRPNITLAGGVFKSGERFLHAGYVGDLVISPYIAYGLSCEDDEMLKESHGTFYKRATDITERNVMRMFYEIENGSSFVAKGFSGDTEHNLGMAKLAEFDAKMSGDCTERPVLLPTENNFYIKLPNVTVNCVSFSSLENYPNKPQHIKNYDLIFVGNNAMNIIKPNVMDLLKDNGLAIFETRKYFVNFKRETIKEFGTVIHEFATAGKLDKYKDFEASKDDFAFYRARGNINIV